jgi:hypothetical protein
MTDVEMLGSIISDLLIVNFMLTNIQFLFNSHTILKIKNMQQAAATDAQAEIIHRSQASIEKSTGTRLKFYTPPPRPKKKYIEQVNFRNQAVSKGCLI